MAGIDVPVAEPSHQGRATKSQSSGALQNESTDGVFGLAEARLHDDRRHKRASIRFGSRIKASCHGRSLESGALALLTRASCPSKSATRDLPASRGSDHSTLQNRVQRGKKVK